MEDLIVNLAKPEEWLQAIDAWTDEQVTTAIDLMRQHSNNRMFPPSYQGGNMVLCWRTYATEGEPYTWATIAADGIVTWTN